MHDKLQKMIIESRFTPSKQNLEELLFLRLEKKIQQKNKIMFTSYLAIGIISTLFASLYAKYFFLDLSNSGVFSYLHLIITEDVETLRLLSKELVYAFFESLPVMSLMLVFGLLFIITLSVGGIMNSLQKISFLKN